MLSPVPANLKRDKKALRREAFERRKSVRNVDAAAEGLARTGLGILEASGTDKNITGYLPVRGEIDSRPLLNALHQKRFTLALPAIIEADTPEMEFRFWTPDASLTDGAFDIPVPPAENGILKDPDILLVPLLAFDRDGFRLGYGGGYYDRALEKMRAKNPRVRAFGLAFNEQEIDAVPREPHDQPLDAVLTPDGVVSVREDRA
ncbi:MAG: 5-formyltetrahydrofolate cyclo-ligase [Hyphomicrobiales bacterium]|nr:5-formyltetrahydrofolate cyclo-ligase [Hyphomicrobiales bacterium]